MGDIVEMDKREVYRERLLRLAPKAIKLLKLALVEDVPPCRVKAAELVLRGSRVIEDGRIVDELNKIREKNKTNNRVFVVRYTTPKTVDTDGE